jgi:glycosyltransferase involved in cell wall biosynthesis
VPGLVSIGIPTYNECNYLRNTLKSVLAQSYDSFEIIVSDNFSCDGTSDMLFKEFGDNQKICIYLQSKNIGMIANFEFVLKMARGEFFMWLGGHDCIHEDYLKLALNTHIKNPGSSLVYFDHQFIDSNYLKVDSPILNSIESLSLDPKSRALKVYKSLTYCTHIHGVWRTKFRSKIYFPNSIGPDHLVLFILGLAGTIHYIPNKNYFRMENRGKQSCEDDLQRYKSLGLKFDPTDIWFTIYKEHLNYLLRNLKFMTFVAMAKHDKSRFKRYISTFSFIG